VIIISYKKSYIPSNGYTPLCVTGECSFKRLEFGIIELKSGDSIVFQTLEREVAFIILQGKADFSFDGQVLRNIGHRRTVFEGKAHSLYLPRRKTVTISTPWSVKIAVCMAPTDIDTEAELITPEKVKVLTLGQTTWKREAHVIIDNGNNARWLNIGECFIDPGNWAGFPPHKHDVSNMPAEDIQEELYYFLFQPEQGFGLQRLYTKDGEIDECYTVKSNDLVEFPRGYHTTVAAPGYNAYFLYVTSAINQGMYRSIDPDHDWILALENLLSKQKK
jgi:5-deoxy-glucuronate isomerase